MRGTVVCGLEVVNPVDWVELKGVTGECSFPFELAAKCPTTGLRSPTGRLNSSRRHAGGARYSISVTTAMERAPFFPTARTAKKWLSVDTPLRTVSAAEVTKS